MAGKYDPFFDRLNADQVSLKTLRELAPMVQGIREGGPDFDICIGTWDGNAASWAVPERPGLRIAISNAVIKEYGIPFEKSH